jgi:hypothetical protein
LSFKQHYLELLDQGIAKPPVEGECERLQKSQG